MIRVTAQPEPAEFETLVRQKGRQYLARNPHPTTTEFANHAYWRDAVGLLRTAYGGICAYSCHLIPVDVGAQNTEHFLPKSKHPQDAYEWENYRYVCQLLNSRKGTRAILDPFVIGDDWFLMDFPSLLIRPNPSLPGATKAQIQETIDILRLNDEEVCQLARTRFIDHYCRENVNFAFLAAEAPFIARELARQNLIEAIKAIWTYSDD